MRRLAADFVIVFIVGAVVALVTRNVIPVYYDVGMLAVAVGLLGAVWCGVGALFRRP